jgi:serine/threonine protein kinase
VDVSSASTEPESIGPYRVVERIGEGGMGVVHLAVSPDGGLVAVKRLRPWLVAGHDGRARFEREVATLRRVRGPRIAEVLDADVAADPPYVVTRYVRGPSLSKVVADHGPLRGEALDRLQNGLLEALASVHAAGVVHRDIKPANVLLADDGPVLIDFGLAHAVGETRLTASGFVAGTPGYLAPEAVLGLASSEATDVHGWAATVAFAATGRPPYGRGPDAAVLDRIRRGEPDLAGIEPGRVELLRRALHVDPGVRPTMRDLLASPAGPDDAATAAMSPATLTEALTDRLAPAASRADDPTAVLGRSVPPTKVDLAATPPAPPSPPPQPPRPRVPGDRRSPAPQARPVTAPRPMTVDGAPLQTWPSRLVVAAAALTLVLIMGLLPNVGALVLIGVLVLGRVVWRIRRRLYDRRVARGATRNDQIVASLGAPVDVVAALLPAVVQGAFVLVSGFLVGAALRVGDFGGVLGVPRAPYLVGGGVALLLAWWGPGAGRFRHGVRVLAAPLERNHRAAWIASGALVAISWILLLLWDSYGTSWWPASGPPNPLGL